MYAPEEVPLSIVGGSSFDRYRKQSIERTYNFFVSNNALVPFAGYQKVSKIALAGEARELYKSTRYKHLISVIDDGVYEVDNNLSSGRVGNVNSRTGEIYITENNTEQVFLADGLNVYVFDYKAQTFDTSVTDFQPVYVTMLDDIIIATDGASNQFRLNDLSAPTTFPNSAAFVGALQSQADLLVAVVAFPKRRTLLVMGETVCEIWNPVSNLAFPFQRNNSIAIEYGCLSRQTIAVGFDKIVWLASNRSAGATLVYTTGGDVTPISTDGIDFELDKLTDPEDSTAFLYEQDGHVFYQITFKTDNISYAYDFNENIFVNVTDHCLNSHIAKRVAFFNNQHYFVSYLDSFLYQLSTSITTLDGEVCPRIRMTSPTRPNNSKRFIINEIGITIEQGNALASLNNTITDEGTIPIDPTKTVSDPRDDNQNVQLSMSKDGGESFGNGQLISLNKIGNRTNRLRWNQLGSANDLTLQFKFWSRSRFVVISGWGVLVP